MAINACIVHLMSIETINWTNLDERREISSRGQIRQLITWGQYEAGMIYRTPVKPSSGRRQIRLNSKVRTFARVLWESFNGSIPAGKCVDHINGDCSDDRIENLRLLTQAENGRAANSVKSSATSRYRGVSFDASRSQWVACIGSNCQVIFLGRFESERLAAMEYNKAAMHCGFLPESLNRIMFDI